MSLIQSILLGIVQGLTEFLPVSSSGHLVILRKLLGISTESSLMFDVMLHAGTLAAVFAAFWGDIKRLLYEIVHMFQDIYHNIKSYLQSLRSKEEQRFCKVVHNNYRKLFIMIVISTLPTALMGVLFESLVKTASSSLLAAGIGLYVTSVMLLVVDFSKDGKKLPRDVGYHCALLIGICQGFAVFPGVSRSGITIAACLLCGFQKKFSVKYSFIMSIPAIIGAMIWEIKGLIGVGFDAIQFMYGLAGVALAAFIGYLCIKLMLGLIRKKRFKYFSGYCFVIGTVALICHFIM